MFEEEEEEEEDEEDEEEEDEEENQLRYRAPHVFLSLALVGGYQLHALAALPRGTRPRHPLERRLGGSHIRSGRCGGVNILEEYKHYL
jgi:hypothetical protein